MVVVLGHGEALADDRYYNEKNKWYYVTTELRGDEIVVGFKDGPVYYLRHDHVKTRPQGFEFFAHTSEIGHLDNVRVLLLADGEQEAWAGLKTKIRQDRRAFLGSEQLDFSTEK